MKEFLYGNATVKTSELGNEILHLSKRGGPLNF